MRLRFADQYEFARSLGLTLKGVNGVYVVGLPLSGGAYSGLNEGSLKECNAFLRGVAHGASRRTR